MISLKTKKDEIKKEFKFVLYDFAHLPTIKFWEIRKQCKDYFNINIQNNE
jgi:hypothetical protein